MENRLLCIISPFHSGKTQYYPLPNTSTICNMDSFRCPLLLFIQIDSQRLLKQLLCLLNASHTTTQNRMYNG